MMKRMLCWAGVLMLAGAIAGADAVLAQAPPSPAPADRPATETAPQPPQQVAPAPPPAPAPAPPEKPTAEPAPPPAPHSTPHEQPAPTVPGPRLTGIAAWAALVGNTVTAKTDDGVVTEFYAADGTVKSMTGSELSAGRWALTGEEICFKYGDDDAECYKIEVIGTTVTFTDEDGGTRRFDLLKGNVKNM